MNLIRLPLRRFFLLLLLMLALSWFIAGGAWAQSAPPSCYPYLSGSAAQGTTLSVQPSWEQALSLPPALVSGVITWWCDEKYQWKGYDLYGFANDMPDAVAALRMYRTYSKDQADAAWRQAIKPCAEGSTDAQCVRDAPLKVIARRQLEATNPGPILWLVKPNGQNDQRPVYALKADGTRDTKTIADRVSVYTTAGPTACQCLALAIEEPISGTSAANTLQRVGPHQSSHRQGARRRSRHALYPIPVRRSDQARSGVHA